MSQHLEKIQSNYEIEWKNRKILLLKSKTLWFVLLDVKYFREDRVSPGMNVK